MHVFAAFGMAEIVRVEPPQALSPRSHPMRRHSVRLVIALLATSVLTACADLATAPETPLRPRFEETRVSADSVRADSVRADSTNTRTSAHQGSEI
jgi:hypothetical protein